MIKYLEESSVQTPGVVKARYPYCQFALNDLQQVAIIGIDFEKMGGIKSIDEQQDGVKSTPLGKLSEQNFILKAQLRNSLDIEGWNFDLWPDPEVLLLEVTAN